MPEFEIAGAVLAGPAVVDQLLKVTLEGYRIFSEAATAGDGLHQYHRELDVQCKLLKDWIHMIAEYGGGLSILVDSMRYEGMIDPTQRKNFRKFTRRKLNNFQIQFRKHTPERHDPSPSHDP
ncbi:hypothetical protein EX30DRAFT_57162 [Ascodesmis nigricans]|uniref:Prion-inhibition and propagation HeLo domain-containing protein n=1 Tax=Ascodesmis nigricans TaxID=341454 RepID=A0A4S2MUU2_9PEZI|nr:hypothetical protein EX30DRAFT_57162 [Ascodesmis nigricans]